MNRELTPEQKVEALIEALRRADRELSCLLAYQEIGSIASPLGKRRCDEHAVSTALRAQKILRRALKKACVNTCTKQSAAARADNKTDKSNKTNRRNE